MSIKTFESYTVFNLYDNTNCIRFWVNIVHRELVIPKFLTAYPSIAEFIFLPSDTKEINPQKTCILLNVIIYTEDLVKRMKQISCNQSKQDNNKLWGGIYQSFIQSFRMIGADIFDPTGGLDKVYNINYIRYKKLESIHNSHLQPVSKK